MSWQDTVNALFEVSGAAFVARSILLLHRQKVVRGVSLATTGFFAAWGWWNLYYYPHLGQWLSFAGALAVMLANTVWSAQITYYLGRGDVPDQVEERQ